MPSSAGFPSHDPVRKESFARSWCVPVCVRTARAEILVKLEFHATSSRSGNRTISIPGYSSMTCSDVQPSARKPRTSETQMRCPRIVGLPIPGGRLLRLLTGLSPLDGTISSRLYVCKIRTCPIKRSAFPTTSCRLLTVWGFRFRRGLLTSFDIMQRRTRRSGCPSNCWPMPN
jgi:hypothetical protein